VADGSAVAGYTLLPDGLHWQKDESAKPVKVCGRIRVLANTMNRLDSEVGVLLAFDHMHTGATVEWIVPRRLFYSEGCAELVLGLVDRGLWLSPRNDARRALACYLALAQPSQTVRTAAAIGWYDAAFVLPDRTIGHTAEPVRFQGHGTARLTTAGTLQGWREGVGRYAVGNPMMVLAIGMGFAAPLLRLVGLDSGGFHFHGSSKDGKSSICDFAGSLWGDPKGYRVTWNGTATGMEYTSASLNDLPMVLDEIGQATPQNVHAVTYQISQGMGKSRGKADGGVRDAVRWCCGVLSNGEHDLASYLAAGGLKVNAGQLVRFINLPVRRQHGAFDALHDQPDHASLCALIATEGAAKHYGITGPAFIEKLIETGADTLRQQASAAMTAFAARVLPPDASGQARHACHYFALSAFAGSLATDWGLTGWPADEAVKACAALFADWLGGRGGAGDHEQMEYVRRLQSFIERNGEGMFAPWHGEELPPPTTDGNKPRTLIRVGYFKEEKHFESGKAYARESDGGDSAMDGRVVATSRIYYIFASSWSEAVFNGLDATAAARHLLALGVLDGGKGKPYKDVRLPGIGTGTRKCYVVNTKLWQVE
jgi:uncharacterized protein (DUF927 family)